MLNFLKKHCIDTDILAVGVSGGADSLALVLWLQESLSGTNKKIVALTVDHRLRPESADEANYVHRLMKKYGIEHHILVWEGEKPQNGIEEAARAARYQLLSDWCHQHSIRYLCIAHHLSDQAETFMMRLQRGSGLSGLCGMQEVSEMYGLKILRPLLDMPPQALKDYLKQKGIDWVTDSSNNCDDFLRVRIRKFLPQMEEAIGISAQRLVETMKVLNRSRDYIQKQTDKFIRQYVRFFEKAGASVSLHVLKEQHKEIVYRVLAEIIRQTGNNDYTARAEDMERLVSVIVSGSLKGATLGHCEVFVFKGKLWIVPELKLKKKMPIKLWDEFINQYPQYSKLDLPYKLRVVLVKTKMKVEF